MTENCETGRKAMGKELRDLGLSSSLLLALTLSNFVCFCFLNCKTGLHQFLSKTLFQDNISVTELSGSGGQFKLESLERVDY